MTILEAIRAEVKDWATLQQVDPSEEVMAQFYSDSLDGATPEEVAEEAIGAVFSLIGRPVTQEEMVELMAVWCSAVLLGVRSAKAAYSVGAGS